MTIEEAIEKAEHNGYKGLSYYECEINVNEHILLDPSFWQSLGKAMGWKAEGRRNLEGLKLINKGSWLYFWHRLINHISAGGNYESFFKELI